ncbi:hypothetical protein Droror1_Dr00018102 [Drosera rotundifolia]
MLNPTKEAQSRAKKDSRRQGIESVTCKGGNPRYEDIIARGINAATRSSSHSARDINQKHNHGRGAKPNLQQPEQRIPSTNPSQLLIHHQEINQQTKSILNPSTKGGIRAVYHRPACRRFRHQEKSKPQSFPAKSNTAAAVPCLIHRNRRH